MFSAVVPGQPWTRQSRATLQTPRRCQRPAGATGRRKRGQGHPCLCSALPELTPELVVTARDFTAFLLGASAGAGAAVLAAQVAGNGAPAPERLVSRLRLKQASKLLSVGPPDKVVTGVGCEVVQHLLDYTWPGIGNALAIALRRRLSMVIEKLESQTIKNIVVEDLSLGEAAPTVLAVKLYSTDPDKVIIDAEVNWDTFDSRLRLQVQLKETLGAQLLVPVEVTRLRYQGVLRIIMTPLLDRAPFFGSMAFTTCSEPDISFSLKVLGGEVMALPGLRQALQDAGVAALKRTFVWPRRIMLPLKRAKALEFLDTVLPQAEIDRLREVEYEDLDPGRVRSWGNPARTRRVARLVEGRRMDRKRPLSRAWSATRTAAATSLESVKRLRGALGRIIRGEPAPDGAEAAAANGAGDAPSPSGSLAHASALEAGDEEEGAAPRPRRRWLSRVWRMLRRVRARRRAGNRGGGSGGGGGGGASAGASAPARAAGGAGTAAVLFVGAAGYDDDDDSATDEEGARRGLTGASGGGERDDDEWEEEEARAAPPEEAMAVGAGGAEEVFSVRGTLLRGVRNAGNGDV